MTGHRRIWDSGLSGLSGFAIVGPGCTATDLRRVARLFAAEADLLEWGNTYRCKCGYVGLCYGTPVGGSVSAPWCRRCGRNDKLTRPGGDAP